ncbi:unnamed protein product [Durusdinium trenchii]|uniref:PIH1D1/2/3 CS-like domain-containing protein n=1 Tax=Durusdinium trenchii TaxID=1381693 RepID=A0ABP0M4G9_9DINO
MPRGPGKRDNYNLDYSRFDQLDRSDAQDHAVQEEMPEDFAVALKNMPPELQEAYRLAMVSRSTGDEAAQQRANELVLQAIEKGGPDVQKRFLDEVSQHLPEGTVQPTPTMPEPPELEESAESMLSRMDQMKAEMEAGREATRKQLDALQKQQEDLQSISSPEDFVSFMQKEGMTNEDIQRMLTDPSHMETMMSKLVERAGDPGEHSQKLTGAESAAKEAEELHKRLCGEAPAKVPKAASKTPEKTPEVILPNHRLQYRKDEQGNYCAMELVCELPGVQEMGCIVLDIAEKHVRLNTVEPAPRYAVNAGPFPVLIEPAAARAKFSKKRSELSVMVPAKG